MRMSRGGVAQALGSCAATGAWKQTSKQRRRVDVSYDPSMAPRHGTWMDEEKFEKTCIKESGKRGGIHQSFYGTWVADFMLT